MAELGLTVSQLARLARVDRTTVSDIINEHRSRVNMQTAASLENVLMWKRGSCEALSAGGEATAADGSSEIAAMFVHADDKTRKLMLETMRVIANRASDRDL